MVIKPIASIRLSGETIPIEVRKHTRMPVIIFIIKDCTWGPGLYNYAEKRDEVYIFEIKEQNCLLQICMLYRKCEGICKLLELENIAHLLDIRSTWKSSRFYTPAITK